MQAKGVAVNDPSPIFDFAPPRRGPWRIDLTAAALLVVAGCGWIERPARFIGGRFHKPPEAAHAEMGPDPVEVAQLSAGQWVQAPTDERRRSDPALPAYRNPALEPLIALQGTARPNLVAALALPEPHLRADAAIVLARWGDGRGYEVLVETVENVDLKLPQRQAAVEALGNLTKPPPAPALERLLDRFGRFDASTVHVYVPDLHADLLRALSRHVDAAVDPRFNEALRAPTFAPRRAALDAWSRTAQGELPTAVVDLRADPHPQIRAAAVALLLTRRHPQAIEFAANALQDFDMDVRTATIAGLARHGGPEAIAALDRVMLHEGEILRAEAVTALHALGASDKTWAAADDKSWRVRKNVAVCLAAHPDRSSAAPARKFLTDPSAEVRRAAVAALESWPLEQAGPVLLAALVEPTYEPRKLAAEQLARRWPPAAEYSPDVPADRRDAAAAALEARWVAQFGPLDRAALAGVASAAAPPAALGFTPAQLDDLQRRLESVERSPGGAAGFAPLETFGPALVDALERLVVERNARLPENVWRQVLPAKSPTLAALEQLTSPDVHERRRAADRLAAAAREAPLRPLVVARLVELGVRETDGLVCRGLFEALAGDGGETAVALALAGLGHESPEVRRLACEHLGRHPDPRRAPLLVAALADPHVGVVLEAVRALGSSGLLADSAPIERLLTSRDPTMRLEAARTLYANRLPSGAAALERLAHDADPEVRRRAAAIVGETGDPQFLPTLIGLLADERLNVRKTAIDGLTALVGRDVSVRPDEPLPSVDERAARWRTWHAARTTDGAIR